MDTEICNTQLCRICITSHTNSMQMISIFGEDSLWQKITTLADVKISKNDTLPQQVCVNCAKTAISACLFKKKCEDADNFYRQQLLIKKIESHSSHNSSSGEQDPIAGESATPATGGVAIKQPKQQRVAKSSGGSSCGGTSSGSSSATNSSSSSDDDDDDEEEEEDADNDNVSETGEAQTRLKNGHGHGQGHQMNGGQPQAQVAPDVDGDEEDEEEEDEEEDPENGELERHRDPAAECSTINGGDERQEDAEEEDDGEIPEHGHTKEPFDFNSIRLMQEYMQHQMNKFPNGSINDLGGTGGIGDDAAHIGDGDEDDDDDEEMSLPLIPEIELITPCDEPLPGSEADHAQTAGGNNGNNGPAHVHPTMRGFQCPHCYQIFEMKQILKAHMQTVHGAPGPVYECSNCRKTYFYKRFLEKHIRRGRCVKKRRNQTRPMQCSDCHVLFPTGHHLGWHKRTGCPSKAAKMPLQQLFKQNIVQFNNFPKRIPAGPRKATAPDNVANSLHLSNRKLGLANKRKGRTRIKLDAKKIALAKQLILREATTTVIANELNISRTFAWRLRKSLVNGVSLHERVVDQANEVNEQQQQQQQQQEQQQQQQHLQQLHQLQQEQEAERERSRERQHSHLSLPYGHLGLGLIKEEQRDSDDEQEHGGNSLSIAEECVAEIGAEETAGYMGEDDVCGLLHNGYEPSGDNDAIEHDSYTGGDDINENEHHSNRDASLTPPPPPPPPPQLAPAPQSSRPGVEVYKRLLVESQRFPHIINAQQLQLQQVQQQQQQQQQKVAHNGGLPMLTRYAPAAVNHALPVNLSLRSIPHLNSNESNGSTNSNATAHSGHPAVAAPTSGGGGGGNSGTTGGVHQPGKKPRKPNVFIDDEKYAMAKLLVAQNSSTMEIARALNVSQMTAWKVRDAILKGVPLSYRNKRAEGGRPSTLAEEARLSEAAALAAKEQQAQQEQQQQQQQQQQRRQQELQRQQQQQQQQLELIKQQRQQQELLLQQQQRQQQQQQQQQQRKQQLRHHTPADTSHYQQQQQQSQESSGNPTQQQQQQQQSSNAGKSVHPRRRLKAAERELRDKEITREILELIKEDSNIQYWKVSARLAEKGINISPSSVCQKLKSMGIHRRWKPGDKPPMLAMSQLKAATVAAAAAATLAANGGAAGFALANGGGAGGIGIAMDDNFDQQQFDMGGPHFLSAFTR